MVKEYGFCIDETTDSTRRNVANVMISILQPQDVGQTNPIHAKYSQGEL